MNDTIRCKLAGTMSDHRLALNVLYLLPMVRASYSLRLVFCSFART